MNVACARWQVDKQVIKLSPISIADELLQCRARHWATPHDGTIGWCKESDRQDLHAVLLDGNDDVLTVDHLHRRLFILAIEHYRYRWSINIGVDQAHSSAGVSQCDSKVACHCRLAYAAFAGSDSENVLHLGQEWGISPQRGYRRRHLYV